VFSNVMMLGCAWQLGLIPVSREAIARAIELNGVSVAANLRAFGWGRLAAVAPQEFAPPADAPAARQALSLDALLERRAAFLREWQDAVWAARYLASVGRVRAVESARCGSETLTTSVAHNLFRLMSYKDEYEVARLYSRPEFRARVDEAFEGDFRLGIHLAPPLLGGGTDASGRPRKREFGPWMLSVMKLLQHGKRLRGTWLDPFARLADRRLERGLIAEYETTLGKILDALDPSTHAVALQLAAAPASVRGFGPVKERAARAARAETVNLLGMLGRATPQVVRTLDPGANADGHR
jgi:indolepyruvate ferredoxin oxidoreductase